MDRTLGLLQCFADFPEDLSASELARERGLTLSTTHRLLQAMSATGFLEQDPVTTRYRLGPVTAELGRLAHHRRGLHRAEPELAELSRRTGATADLAVRVGSRAVILAGGSLDHDHSRGVRRPLHSTALGKVLLAWPDAGAADLESLPPLTALTDRTITDLARLREELAQTRIRGFAVNDGESVAGIRTVAVPILDVDDRALFALALRSSPDVITTERLGWFVEHALECVSALQVHLIAPDRRRRPPLWSRGRS
ncbi:MAG: IclR family transcriptional regulator [Gordonia sp. (in: high G+C Gram-positive bacteria)]